MKKSIIKQKGFTIVELLVVIVVIGILAAITIVSYTGVTSRANKVSAVSAARSLLGKVEVYNAEISSWPATYATLTSATADKSYYVPASSYTLATSLLSAVPASPNTLNFLKCGTTGSATVPTSAATITVQSGVKIGYWDYGATPPAIAYLSSGGYTTDPGTYLTFPSRCFPAQS